MYIGKRVRELREERDLLQEELARRANIAPNTLSRIELGYHDPSAATITRLAQGLNVEPGVLFETSLVEAPSSGLSAEEITDALNEYLSEHDAKLTGLSLEAVKHMLDRADDEDKRALLRMAESDQKRLERTYRSDENNPIALKAYVRAMERRMVVFLAQSGTFSVRAKGGPDRIEHILEGEEVASSSPKVPAPSSPAEESVEERREILPEELEKPREMLAGFVEQAVQLFEEWLGEYKAGAANYYKLKDLTMAAVLAHQGAGRFWDRWKLGRLNDPANARIASAVERLMSLVREADRVAEEGLPEEEAQKVAYLLDYLQRRRAV